jgi:hypothetical protein
MSNSLNNVRQLLVATSAYRLDHADRVPLRGRSYGNGQLNGWDTWHFAGKNCDAYWQTNFGGGFDEHVHWRFLNPYVQASPAPVPSGFVNTGSGPTWNFQQGTLTAQQRTSFTVKACRSPGDVGTRQRTWPTPRGGQFI